MGVIILIKYIKIIIIIKYINIIIVVKWVDVVVSRCLGGKGSGCCAEGTWKPFETGLLGWHSQQTHPLLTQPSHS